MPQSLAQPVGRPVTVRANGLLLATLSAGPGWQAYALDLPPAVANAPQIVVTFDSLTQQASSTDPRYISFALRSASVAPAR